MNSKESIKKAVAGSHTVFLVTNYWESMNPETEITQGTNVADVAKEAGVSHIIFSSLLNVTEASGGRLKHVPHFDCKAKIEQHIRAMGITCTFVLPGYFMSNFAQSARREEDGSYTLACPVGETAKFPLFDVVADAGKLRVRLLRRASCADVVQTGLFVKPALKDPEALNGKRILAATDYYTPQRILAEFEEVTGNKTRYVHASAERYKSALPEAVAEELYENHLFIENPGYYNGASLQESLILLDKKPTTWKEYVEQNGGF